MPGIESRAPERTDTSSGIRRVAELACPSPSRSADARLDLRLQRGRVGPLVRVVVRADLGRDREARRAPAARCASSRRGWPPCRRAAASWSRCRRPCRRPSCRRTCRPWQPWRLPCGQRACGQAPRPCAGRPCGLARPWASWGGLPGGGTRGLARGLRDACGFLGHERYDSCCAWVMAGRIRPVAPRWKKGRQWPAPCHAGRPAVPGEPAATRRHRPSRTLP